MVKEFILSLVMLLPHHELNKKPELLEQVSGYFESAGENYRIDPTLLVYWAWKESRLKTNVVAHDRPSIGYSQAHGYAQKWCEKQGYKIQQREGGAMCVGYLFRRGIDTCGNLEKAAVWYASGSCKSSKKVRRKMASRLSDWQERKLYIEQEIIDQEKLHKLEEDCTEAH